MTLDEAVEKFRSEPTQVNAVVLAYEVTSYHDDGMIEASTVAAYYDEISAAGFSIYR
jgi:hypothetical protein